MTSIGTTMKRAAAIVATATASAAMVGCTDRQDAGSGEAGSRADRAAATEAADQDEFPAGWYGFIDRVTRCEIVAPYIAEYTEDLVLDDYETDADEYGLACHWEPPEDNADFDNLRSVEIIFGPGDGAPLDDESLAMVEQIEDADLERVGGIAYTLTGETSVGAAIVTSVETPDVEVSITGGEWGDYPSLDSAAAVDVAKQILQIG